VKLPGGGRFREVNRVLEECGLHTVCRSAKCPNLGSCWARKAVTFMILGYICTRSCRFCAVTSGRPSPPDPDEPSRIAEAVGRLSLRYVVITSVTRDDLDDGGASIFARTVRAIREAVPRCRVELLIPDFKGSERALMEVLESRPDVVGHNIETVRRLYPRVRPGADYKRSLDIIGEIAKSGIASKSGFMVGLGESTEEAIELMRELRDAGCALLTIGQYLQPLRTSLPVERYYAPEEFKSLEDAGYELGFSGIASGPLVRSSYRAEELAHNILP